MKTLVVCILLGLFTSNCLSQISLESHLDSMSSDLKSKFIYSLSNDKNIESKVIKQLDFVILPVVRFNDSFTKFNDSTKEWNLYNYLEIDQQKYWGIALLNKILFADYKEGSNNLPSIMLYTNNNLKEESFYEMQIINELKKRGIKFIFYLNFLSKYPRRFNPIGFFDSGKIKIIDEDLNEYQTIKEYLQSKYGSIDKYNEFLQFQIDQKTIRNNLFNEIEKVKKFYSSNFLEWNARNPNDTATAIKFLISEIAQSTKINDIQNTLFEKEIFKALRYPQFQNLLYINRWEKNDGIALFNIDLRNIIENILPKRQLDDFLYQHKINQSLIVPAYWKIYDYYKALNKNQKIDIDTIINKELFKNTY